MQPVTRSFDRDRLWQILTLAAILGTLGVNIFSNLFPLNGLNIGEISNTLFANVQIIPANYAFAIWGVIYLGLIAFGIYQLTPALRENPPLRHSRYWLVSACLAQIVWVFLFLSRQFVLSVVAMLAILLPLIAIYLQLKAGQQRVSREDRWLIHTPISIYLGWITVATVVNVASALYHLGWNGGGIAPEVWTALLISISAAIAAYIALKHRDAAYTLVIIWAFVAIAVKHWNTTLIAGTALVMSVGLLLLLVLGKQRAEN